MKNPFAKIEPPLQNEPQIRYLLLSDIRRLLAYLKVRQQGYGSALAFNLANSLFQTACRFDELIRLTWADCQRVGEEIVALRIKGKGSVFQDVPVTGALPPHQSSQSTVCFNEGSPRPWSVDLLRHHVRTMGKFIDTSYRRSTGSGY